MRLDARNQRCEHGNLRDFHDTRRSPPIISFCIHFLHVFIYNRLKLPSALNVVAVYVTTYTKQMRKEINLYLRVTYHANVTFPGVTSRVKSCKFSNRFDSSLSDFKSISSRQISFNFNVGMHIYNIAYMLARPRRISPLDAM